jgi:hypothetical protein
VKYFTPFHAISFELMKNFTRLMKFSFAQDEGASRQTSGLRYGRPGGLRYVLLYEF